MKDQDFNFFWLFNLLNRNIKSSFIISILTFIFSAYVSLYVIQPKFKSSVVIYPTTTNSISEALLVEHNPYRKDVLEFGEEQEAELLLQVLNSDEMRDSIIRRFDLYKHFNVNQDEEFHKTTVNTIYANLINIKKTKFNSIEIIVLDRDPVMASNIANEYLTLNELLEKARPKNKPIKGILQCQTQDNIQATIYSKSHSL